MKDLESEIANLKRKIRELETYKYERSFERNIDFERAVKYQQKLQEIYDVLHGRGKYSKGCDWMTIARRLTDIINDLVKDGTIEGEK